LQEQQARRRSRREAAAILTATLPPASAIGRVDLLIAAVLAIGALVVYGFTLCRTLYTGDVGEVAGAVWVAGVLHAPGYPLYCAVTASLTRLFAFGDPVLRANAISALYAAAAVASLFFAARLWSASRWAAAAAAVALATGRNFWSQALVAEVYAADALLLAVTILVAARAARTDAPQLWMLLGVAAGLACGHRPLNVLYLAPFVLVAESLRPGQRIQSSVWGAFLVGGISTTVVFLYLPWAASRRPPMNMGDPSSWRSFWEMITALAYHRHMESTTWSLASHRFLASILRMPLQLGVGALAAAVGLWTLAARRGGARRFFLAIAFVVVVNLAFVSAYNILDNTGYGQPSLVALALAAAVGFDRLLAWASGRNGNAPWERPVLGGVAIAAALAALAWNYNANDLSSVRDARAYGEDVLDAVEPRGLVITSGDTQRATTSYLQAVEGRRPDVAVLGPAMLLQWHVEEIQRRAPAAGMPSYQEGQDRRDWFDRLLRERLRDGGVYTTEPPERILFPYLQPQLAGQVRSAPWGVLYRVMIEGIGPGASEIAGRFEEVNETFWARRRIPTPRLEIEDAQLHTLAVFYAEARLALATVYLARGDVHLAKPHLEAIALSDVDAREAIMLAALAAIGKVRAPLQPQVRSRRALERLAGGNDQAATVKALRELIPR
jgi:4-amino-4-deoxy-L-arabinose transferase-like glycosyltransferase